MRLVKLSVLAAFALLALGVVGSTAASAAPQILCLVNSCISGFEQTFETEAGGSTFLESLAGKVIKSTSAKSTIKGCEAEGAEKQDASLCKDQTIEFKGSEEPAKKVKCNTEGDAAGVVLVLLDLHLGAELNAAKELEGLLLAKVLNAKLEAKEITIKCGVLNVLVKGTVACLVGPINKVLAVGAMVELLCKINTGTHDPETGTCNLECGELEKDPFLSNFSGTFEDAWMNIHLLTTLTKDIQIDA